MGQGRVRGARFQGWSVTGVNNPDRPQDARPLTHQLHKTHAFFLLGTKYFKTCLVLLLLSGSFSSVEPV